jgi:dephospho-CoA kinase
MSSIQLIAITGGIGAGKSVVQAVLRNAGYSVYDCDSRAKQLMTESAAIRQALTERFGCDIYSADRTLNRQLLSSKIFNDPAALAFVNSVVHPAVREDIACWAKQQERMPAFVETAILKEGGMEHMMTQVWNVTAPQQVRIERVMRRNGASRQQVAERINNQHDYSSDSLPVHSIVNDGTTPILPQVMQLLEQFS